MIGPDGTVFPNHHRYVEVRPEERIGYTLLWGENGPKHADAWASFEDQDGETKVVLGMVFSTEAEFQQAKGFGAVEAGSANAGQTGTLRQGAVDVELEAPLLANDDQGAEACRFYVDGLRHEGESLVSVISIVPLTRRLARAESATSIRP